MSGFKDRIENSCWPTSINFRYVIVANLMYIGTAVENNVLPPKNNIRIPFMLLRMNE